MMYHAVLLCGEHVYSMFTGTYTTIILLLLHLWSTLCDQKPRYGRTRCVTHHLVHDHCGKTSATVSHQTGSLQHKMNRCAPRWPQGHTPPPILSGAFGHASFSTLSNASPLSQTITTMCLHDTLTPSQMARNLSTACAQVSSMVTRVERGMSKGGPQQPGKELFTRPVVSQTQSSRDVIYRQPLTPASSKRLERGKEGPRYPGSVSKELMRMASNLAWTIPAGGKGNLSSLNPIIQWASYFQRTD